MAKKASGKNETKARSKGARKSDKAGTAVAVRSSAGGSRSQDGMGEAFIKLLQSPLAAELVAVAATAALASLAEQGFTGEGSRGKRAGQAVKKAGKAAAAAIGRRLGTEIEEIRKAATGAAKG
jgi:hypothetical protein